MPIIIRPSLGNGLIFLTKPTMGTTQMRREVSAPIDSLSRTTGMRKMDISAIAMMPLGNASEELGLSITLRTEAASTNIKHECRQKLEEVQQKRQTQPQSLAGTASASCSTAS